MVAILEMVGEPFLNSELQYSFAGSYTNEVMRTAEEYLESLRGKVWLIPKNFVEVLDISFQLNSFQHLLGKW